MNWPYPLNAPEISVEWRHDEYGLGITAMTDEAGQPYIGLYPLDLEGIQSGQPIYFRRSRLIADILVGYNNYKPASIYIDADVSMRGLDVRLRPFHGFIGPKQPCHLYACWRGSNSPQP